MTTSTIVTKSNRNAAFVRVSGKPKHCSHCGKDAPPSEFFGRDGRWMHRPCISKGPIDAVEARVASMRITAWDKLAGPERVNVLKQKYPQIANGIDMLANSDPTGGQQKYLDWEVRMVLKSPEIKLGVDTALAWSHPIEMITTGVNEFHRFQKYLGSEKYGTKDVKKDINAYKSPEDLHAMLKSVEEKVIGPIRIEKVEKEFPKEYSYAIRELARRDPTGKQDYLQFEMQELDVMVKQRQESFKITDEDIKEFVDRISDVMGKWHQLKQNKNVESVEGELGEPHEYGNLNTLSKKVEKLEPFLAEGVDQPHVIARNKKFVMYGPITNKAQLCTIGSSSWCVADWGRGNYFEQYMKRGREDGDVYFLMIEPLNAETDEKWLAFVVDGAVDEFRDERDDDADPTAFSDLFEKAGVTAEGGEIEIYYAIGEDEDDPTYISEDLDSVENDAGENLNLRGRGYSIYSATVKKRDFEDDENGAERSNERRINSFEPETEARYIIAPYDVKDAEEAQKHPIQTAETEDQVEAWISGNPGAWADSGYKVFKVELPVNELNEQPRYWEMGNAELYSEQEPDTEAYAKLNQPIQIFYSVGQNTYGENVVLHAAKTEAELKRHPMNDAEEIYTGYVTGRDFAKAERSDKWNRLVPQNPRKVRDVAAREINRYVVFRSGKPVQNLSGGSVDEAKERFKRMQETNPHADLELRKLTVRESDEKRYAWPVWPAKATSSEVLDTAKGKTQSGEATEIEKRTFITSP